MVGHGACVIAKYRESVDLVCLVCISRIGDWIADLYQHCAAGNDAAPAYMRCCWDVTIEEHEPIWL